MREDDEAHICFGRIVKIDSVVATSESARVDGEWTLHLLDIRWLVFFFSLFLSMGEGKRSSTQIYWLVECFRVTSSSCLINYIYIFLTLLRRCG